MIAVDPKGTILHGWMEMSTVPPAKREPMKDYAVHIPALGLYLKTLTVEEGAKLRFEGGHGYIELDKPKD